MTRRSVEIVVISEIYGVPIAVLQRRGEWNHEKMKRESWPGVCQVTAHGRSEDKEDDFGTLERELVEELGHEAMSLLITNAKLAYDDNENATYAVMIRGPELAEFLRKVRLSASTGGLLFVRRETLQGIEPVDRDDATMKEEGITDRRRIVMFPDEIAALERAFAYVS